MYKNPFLIKGLLRWKCSVGQHLGGGRGWFVIKNQGHREVNMKCLLSKSNYCSWIGLIFACMSLQNLFSRIGIS